MQKKSNKQGEGILIKFFSSALSRNNLSRIRDGARLINLENKKIKEHVGFHYLLTKTHWIYSSRSVKQNQR